MKESKPLLFINSATSETKAEQSQYVYDSRYDKKTPIVKKQPEQKLIPEEKPVVIKEPEEEKNEKEAEIEEQPEPGKKLINKIMLLDKRAKMGRPALVQVNTPHDEITGLFMGLSGSVIVLDVYDVNKEIPLSDIENVQILQA